MKAALSQLFVLAGIEFPVTVTPADIQKAVAKLKTQLKGPSDQALSLPNPGDLGKAEGNNALSQMAAIVQGDKLGAPKADLSNETILIVGELGIVTYQLKLSLSKLGANVAIAKGIDEALSEYHKRDYTAILIDIFMPTEREGMIVLSEIKRMERELCRSTDVVILASPVREKEADLKEQCRQRGAAIFLDKTEGWHQGVIDYFSGQRGWK